MTPKEYIVTPYFMNKLAEIKTDPPRKDFYRMDTNIIMPEPEILREGEYILIMESDHEKRFSVATPHPGRSKFTIQDVEHLPHDMVLSYLRVIEKDLPFKNFFPRCDDYNDNSSPDLIYKDQDTSIFIEVGTTQGNTDSTYDRKMRTYREAIMNRCGASWIYLVLSVSRTKITTNFPLSPEDADMIMMSYTYGLMIKERIMQLGVRLDHDDEDSRVKEQIRQNLFSEINKEGVDTQDDLFMDEEFLMKTREVDITDYLLPVISDAQEDFYYKTSPNYKQFDVRQFIQKNYANPEITYKELPRANLAAVVNFPCCIMFPTYEMDNSQYGMTEPIEFDDGPYARFWSEMRNQMLTLAQDDETQNQLENLRTDKTMDYRIDTAEKYRSKEFLEKGRVKVTMNYHDEEYFARRGLNGKKHKDDYHVLEERSKAKLGYHWDTDTVDIENFINRTDMFDEVDHVNPISRILDPLYSQYFSQIEGQSAHKFKQFLSTKLGFMTSFISSLAAELNINIRKPTKGKEWILTYNRTFNFSVAIKNTGSNKHSFFSVLIPKNRVDEVQGLPFAEWIDLGNYYCSELFSTRAHDLSMHVGMITKVFTTYMIMTDVLNEEATLRNDFRFMPEVLSAFLISMENKEKTSAPLQNVRYMYMDLLTTMPSNSDPFKVFTKFDSIIRNRLILYFMKKLVIAFEIMVKNKKDQDMMLFKRFDDELDEDDENPEKEIESEIRVPTSQDSVTGMISFISLKPLKTYEEALNLSYMGVFHEKDKAVEDQGFLKIFSKVIKEEVKMRPDQSDVLKMGKNANERSWSNDHPKSYKSHEFSVPHVRAIGKMIKSKLRSMGTTPLSLRDIIMTNLSRVCFEELATFKASAEYKDYTSGDLPFFGYKQHKRRKCLSAILSLMEEIGSQGRCPFSSFKKLFKLFKQYGGLIANLFKKNQLTGLREIFVLYIHARVVVNFLETVSRSICELMPNEYLTKGTEKAGAIHTHYSSVAAQMKYRIGDEEVKTETVCDSADATTWCQRFVMPTFGIMFDEIFGTEWPEMNHTLISILNEVTFKRLELPEKMLKIFMKNPDVFSPEDEGMNELKRQFLNISDKNDLNKGFSMFLNNRSNFMQGILHYTSSLIHSGHLLLVSSWISKMSEVRFGKDVKMITTTLCSSDDATRITTALFKKNNAKLHKRVIMFLVFTSSLLKMSYPLFTAQLSHEKSTLANLTKVCEFNSVWYFRNTILTPKIKWAFAAMQYKSSSSAVERQLQDHNLINDLISNGCSTEVANDVQFACAINHYDCCGLLTQSRNVMRALLSEMAISAHPMAYFYFLSNPKTSTVLGYQYTKYWNLKQFEFARRTELLSRKSLIGETTDIGGRSYAVKLRVGSSHKYYKFITKEIPIDKESIEDEILRDPEFMFRPSKSAEEEKMKIMMKAHSPGAEKSFSFDSGSKQHMISSYIVSKPCISVSSKDRSFKCSLAYLTKMILDKIIREDETKFEFTYAQFPQMDLYERLEDVLKETIEIKTTARSRKIKTKIRLPKSKMESINPLKDVLSTLWFSQDPRSSRAMYRLSLQTYKQEYPWITDGFHTSWKAFSDLYGRIMPSEFVTFITNSEEREPTIEFLHSGRKRVGAFSTLQECLFKNYSKRSMLSNINAKIIRERMRSTNLDDETFNRSMIDLQNLLDEIETCLARAKTVISEYDRLLMMNWAIKRQNMITLMEIDDRVLSKINRKSHALLIMTAVNQKPRMQLDEAEIMHLTNLYQRMNQGVMIWYKQVQKKQGDQYIGDGLVDLKFPTASMTLRIKGNVVTEIFSSKKSKVGFYSNELTHIITSTLACVTRTELFSAEYSCPALTIIGKRGIYKENSHTGTPVRDLKHEIIEPRSTTFHLHLNRAADLVLRIMTGVVEGDSLRVNAKNKIHDLVPDVPPTGITRYNKEWIDNKPFSARSIRSMLDDAEETEEIKDWIRASLSSRLMIKNYNINKLTSLDKFFPREEEDDDVRMTFEEDIIEAPFSETEYLNMADSNISDLDFFIECTTIDNNDFFKDSDFIEVENPDVYGYSNKIRITAKSSYFFASCSWDKFILTTEKIYKKRIDEIASSGYPDDFTPDMIRLANIMNWRHESEFEPEESYDSDVEEYGL